MTKLDNEQKPPPSSVEGRTSEDLLSSSGALAEYFTGEEVTANLPSVAGPKDPLEMETPVAGLPEARAKGSEGDTPIIFSPVAAARTPTPDGQPDTATDPGQPAMPRWAAAVMMGLVLLLLVLIALLLKP